MQALKKKHTHKRWHALTSSSLFFFFFKKNKLKMLTSVQKTRDARRALAARKYFEKAWQEKKSWGSLWSDAVCAETARRRRRVETISSHLRAKLPSLFFSLYKLRKITPRS